MFSTLISNKLYFLLLFFLYACVQEKTCLERLKDYLNDDFSSLKNDNIVFYYIPEYGCASCYLKFYKNLTNNVFRNKIILITNREFENQNNIQIFRDLDKKYHRLPCLGKNTVKIYFKNDILYIQNIRHYTE